MPGLGFQSLFESSLVMVDMGDSNSRRPGCKISPQGHSLARIAFCSVAGGMVFGGFASLVPSEAQAGLSKLLAKGPAVS